MKRVVFLVDMNAFFISCEMIRQPSLRGVPAAVAGDPKTRTGIILAANYEARSYGVRTAMVLHKAMELCPGMVIVPPDHAYYEQKSSEVMELLAGFTPVVEQNSIDEAWLDMSGCEGLFGTPAESAARIMEEIKDKLGLWCSIGIAENKFLAKMASEMKKPLGITELWPQDIPIKLWPLPVKSIYGVGGKTADKLNSIGIQTIGDLARVDRPFLVRMFGKSGVELHEHANGIDNAPVLAHERGEMKQIGRSTTLPEDVADLDQARLVLMELADDIGMSARRHGKRGRTIHITLKYTDFTVVTRQATMPATSTTHEIYLAGFRLLEQNWDVSRPIRLIGIALSGFDEAEEQPRQMTLFDPAESTGKPTGRPVDDKKKQKIDQVMDHIRNRLGDDAVGMAALIRRPMDDAEKPGRDRDN